VYLRPWNFHFATQHVIELTYTFSWYFHTDDVWFTSGQTTLHFFLRKIQTATVITWRLTTCLLFCTHLIQFFCSCETVEGMTFLYQLQGIIFIDIHAFSLAIRRMRATDIRTFRPVQTQPAQ